MNYNENDLAKIGDRVAINFIHHMSYLHGDLNNARFFTVIRKYIQM